MSDTHNDNRGQVGIGTLIVFIAMVLVAAIAAGVLVNTADMLQESAEQTGEESQAQVSDRIQIIDIYGESDTIYETTTPADGVRQYVESDTETAVDLDGDGTNGDVAVHELGFVMMRAAGANDINLETVTVSWIGPDGAEQVTMDDDQFTIDDTVAGSDNNLLDSNGDRAKVTLVLSPLYDGDATAYESTNFQPLLEGSEVTVRFNTEAGATVTKRINVPTLLQDDETIVL